MSAAKVLKYIKEKDAEFVDLRFTDPRGKLQHLTMDASIVDEGMLNEGVFFDGSSIAGWKAINESDMILKPDLERQVIDPFTSHNTLILFCDVLDAVKKDPYERDPRSIAKKAEANGSKIITGVKVTGFKRGSNSKAITGVETDKGIIDCEQVVVGVGPWVRDIWNMLELPQTVNIKNGNGENKDCLLYTSPSPRDA